MVVDYLLFVYLRPVSLLFGAIVPSIPLREGAEALTEWGGGTETEILFEGCCVCKGDGYVAGLHGDEFFVRLEVIVGREHTCFNKLFLQDGDEVKEVLGRVVADVIDFVRWNW